MEKSETKRALEVQMLVDYAGAADEKPVQHTNEMTFQIHKDEVYLTFFQLTPPVLLGTPEEQAAQLKSRETIRPDCVARLVLTPDFLKDVFHVIQNNLEKYEAAKKDEAESKTDAATD